MTDIQKIQNEMATDAKGGAMVEQSRTIQEIAGQMLMARQLPRDPALAEKRLVAECRRPKLAESAEYSFPRQDTEVRGPSIRLAEAAARCWGNLDWGIREIASDEEGTEIVAYALDLETNTRRSRSLRVPHYRSTRQGPKKLTDPRDIYEHVANYGARRVRDCLLSLVPGDIVDTALDACRRTAEQGNGDPVDVRRERMAEKFAAYGITKEQLAEKVGRKWEAIDAPEIGKLGRIFRAIDDGMVDAASAFPVKAESMRQGNAQAPQNRAEEKPGTRAAPADSGNEAPQDTPEDDEPASPDGASEAEQADRIIADIERATTPDDIDVLQDIGRELHGSQKARVTRAANNRREALAGEEPPAGQPDPDGGQDDAFSGDFD